MISWQVMNFTYIPLNVNCLSEQGPSCRLNDLVVTENVASARPKMDFPRWATGWSEAARGAKVSRRGVFLDMA